jgi:hypothetical protein
LSSYGFESATQEVDQDALWLAQGIDSCELDESVSSKWNVSTWNAGAEKLACADITGQVASEIKECKHRKTVAALLGNDSRTKSA